MNERDGKDNIMNLKRKHHHHNHKWLNITNTKLEHWENQDEMHKVINMMPGYMNAIFLELLSSPMNGQQLQHKFDALEFSIMPMAQKMKNKVDLDADLKKAVNNGILELNDKQYCLTPRGRELAMHVETVIPQFFEYILSERVITRITIIIHIVLSIFKLLVGFISGSAGLVADGIDNTVDTITSLLVWIGLKYDRDKLVSSIILIMMYVSVVGVSLTSYDKFANPHPIEEGFIAFFLTALFGLTMLLLSIYQYVVGKRRSNFSIQCQSIDSRNHFYTSILVCLGIVLSYVAVKYDTMWLLYADAIASAIIGALILRSTIELTIEFFKPEEQQVEVSHFIGNAQQRLKRKLIYGWLASEIGDYKLSREELVSRFENKFCDSAPRLFMLTRIGHWPSDTDELDMYLKYFVESNRINDENGFYSLNKAHSDYRKRKKI